MDEGGPCLFATPWCELSGILLDGVFAHPNAQLEQFASDPFGIAQAILSDHPFDQHDQRRR